MATGGVGEHARRLRCDLLLMAGGWTPSVHLFSQSRGKLRFDETLQAFVPGAAPQHERLGRRLPRASSTLATR